MEIYKKSCLTVQECLEGLISHPAMIILTIFFNIDTWTLEAQKKLCEPRKIKSISNLFVSALAKDWENCDVEKTKAMIDNVTTKFALMNEIFPCPTIEMRLELNRLMYLDTRKMLFAWINDQCHMIDLVDSQIRPANMDQFIATCKECRTTGNHSLLFKAFKGIGAMWKERTNRILRHQVGVSLNQNNEEQNVMTMTMTLNVLKIFSILTMEDQVKTMCGKVFI